jgi:acetyl esterase/lipase
MVADVAGLLLLVLGVGAAAGVANATWPRRTWWGIAMSWIAAWVTVELAPHLVVLSALLAAALVAIGALDSVLGWMGLLILAAAELAALPMVWRARRTVVHVGRVLKELEPHRSAHPFPRLHVALPFLMTRRRGVQHVRGVEFARAGGRRLKLDVYLPAEPSDTPRPAVIQVHGGGWVIGTRREQAIPLLNHLAANGWVGFSIDYRLSPWATFPDHVVDVKRAIAWVRDHASEYGVDPSFIALTGGSAGGHLCALAALTAGDSSLQPGFEHANTAVAAAVPFYGMYDMLDDEGVHAPAIFSWVLEPLVFKARRRNDPERFRSASPRHRIHAAAPPFFVIHGERDSILAVEDARGFAEALRGESRNVVLYAEMKGGQHAFDLIPTWRTVPVVEAIEGFLTTVYRRRDEPPAVVDDRLEEAMTD